MVVGFSPVAKVCIAPIVTYPANRTINMYLVVFVHSMGEVVNGLLREAAI